MATSRNLIGIPISLELFQEFFTTGRITQVKCIEGIPADATMVNSFYDGYRQTAVLVYEHESFPEVSEGQEIQMVTPVFSRIEYDEYKEELVELPKLGSKGICKMCNQEIVYIGPYWDHPGEIKPRHPAFPKEEKA